METDGSILDSVRNDGHETRGLFYKDTNYARLNLTSLRMLDASCQGRQ
jgi:hypothetical protein